MASPNLLHFRRWMEMAWGDPSPPATGVQEEGAGRGLKGPEPPLTEGLYLLPLPISGPQELWVTPLCPKSQGSPTLLPLPLQHSPPRPHAPARHRVLLGLH